MAKMPFFGHFRAYIGHKRLKWVVQKRLLLDLDSMWPQWLKKKATFVLSNQQLQLSAMHLKLKLKTLSMVWQKLNLVIFEPILPDGYPEQPRQILQPVWSNNTWERLVLVSLGRKNDFRKPVILSPVELCLRRECLKVSSSARFKQIFHVYL